MLAKKHLFTSCPAAKHQNSDNLGLQTYEKNHPENLGFFAKVSIPVESIIPCCKDTRVVFSLSLNCFLVKLPPNQFCCDKHNKTANPKFECVNSINFQHFQTTLLQKRRKDENIFVVLCPIAFLSILN